MARRIDPPDAATDGSPCVRNCCLDDGDVCVGCGRSLDEILRWQRADPEERRAMRELARERLRVRLTGRR